MDGFSHLRRMDLGANRWMVLVTCRRMYFRCKQMDGFSHMRRMDLGANRWMVLVTCRRMDFRCKQMDGFSHLQEDGIPTRVDYFGYT
jgi:hypothetical protein